MVAACTRKRQAGDTKLSRRCLPAACCSQIVTVRVAVRDTGAGISKEQQAALFTP